MLSPRQMYPDAECMIRVQGCGERCVRSESFVPWSVADRVSGELCALGVDSESLGVGRASTTVTELRSHYANTRLYNWCGVMCVGPRTLRVM